MAYKALGWAVWKGARLFLRRRYGGTITKRRAIVAGTVVGVAAGLATLGLKSAQE